MSAARAEKDRRMLTRIRRVLAWLAVLLIVTVSFLFFLGDRLLSDFLISDGETTLESADWNSGMRFGWKERGRISRSEVAAKAEVAVEVGEEGRSEPEEPFDRRQLLDERGATLDPRTGDLVFARRVPEQGWDLLRARWSPRGWREPESLFELNSTSDDVDARFSADGAALWFASRREGGQGGYDLWRAWREDEGFTAPENLGPIVNGPEDERHPAPGAQRLILASNRLAVDATRYELFEARPAVDDQGQSIADWSRPELIAELAIEGDAESRSPALSADGRFLYFASDRAGGEGGFDLWRSLRFDGRWRPAQPLDALNTAADELDPALSREGMTLVFARRRAEDPAALACALQLAERRELMQLRRPGDAPWRRLLTILAAVLVVLLLTLLALKWQSLHPFVKFLILSIVLHLLFLIFAKPPEDLGLGKGDGGDQAFAVTFLPSEDSAEAPSARAATGDRVAAERQATASAAASAQAQAREMAAAPAAPADAPASAAPSRAASAQAEAASELSAPERTSRHAATAMNAAASQAEAAAASSSSFAKRSATAREVKEAASRAQGLAPASAEPLANSGVKVAPRSEAESAPAGRGAPSKPNATSLSGRAVAEAMGESSSDVAVPSAARSESTARSGASLPRPSLAKAGSGTTNVKKAGKDPRAGELAGAARSLDGTSSRGTAKGKAVSGAAPIARGESEGQDTDLNLTPRDLTPGGGGASSSQDRREAVAEGSSELPASTPFAQRGRARHSAEIPSALPEGRAKRRGEATASVDGATEAAAGEATALATDPRRRGDLSSAAPSSELRGDSSAPSEGFGPRDLVSRRSESSLGERPAAMRGSDFGSRRRRPRLGSGGPSASKSRAESGSGADVAKDPTRGTRAGAEAGEDRSGTSARRLDVAPRRTPALLASLSEGRRARGQKDRSVDLAPQDLLRRRAARLGQEEAQGEAADVYARRRGQARVEALEAAGGTAETEAAVLSGLRYLKSKQRNGGPWGTGRRDEKYGDLRAGKTGLALLAFLGSGYTHQRAGEFQATVRQGLDYLLQVQNRRNGHIGQGAAYGHGIATYALAEAYAMTQDEDLRQPLWRATQRILAAQVKSRRNRLDGAWRYYYADEDRSFDRWPRMSVTVWQVMALESARIGGIRVPDEALKRARGHVSRAWDGDREAFRYNHDPDWVGNRYPILPGSSAAAVFALQLLGGEQNAADRQHIRAGLDFCLERSPNFRWRKPSQDNFVFRGQGNEYFLYYATLALRMQGGADWRAWNDRLKPLLLDNQSEDGSWRPISYYADYAQDTNRDRSYTTAMCVLMLEAYYRYDTPLLKKLARELTEEAPTPTSEVIVDSLDQGSAAARARLRAGDVILTLDGIAVPTIVELERVNDTIDDDARPRIKIRRGDRELILRGRGALAGLTVREEDL